MRTQQEMPWEVQQCALSDRRSSRAQIWACLYRPIYLSKIKIKRPVMGEYYMEQENIQHRYKALVKHIEEVPC